MKCFLLLVITVGYISVAVEGQLKCYKCDDVEHVSGCLFKAHATCKTGEVCLEYSKQQGGKTLYSMGCSPQTCQVPTPGAVTNMTNPGAVIGRRATPVTCKQCCSTSLCNLALCTGHSNGNSHVTAVPVSTSTTTPAPLNLVVVPSKVNQQVGELAGFECNFDRPVSTAMNMTWTFKNTTGHVTTIYQAFNATPPEQFLDVKKVALSDAGVYTCTATDGVMTWTASSTMDVIAASLVSTISPAALNTTAWNLKTYPANQSLALGDTAVILCQFDPEVDEDVTMTWTFTNMAGNTTQIFSDGEPESSMTFYVKELEHSDQGVYTCKAFLHNKDWVATSYLQVK